MNHWEGMDRLGSARNPTASRQTHEAARLPGDQGGRTRGRAVGEQDYLRQQQKLSPEAFSGREARRRQGMSALARRREPGGNAERRGEPRAHGENESRCGKAAARADFSGACDARIRFFPDVGVRHFRSGWLEEAKARVGRSKRSLGNSRRRLYLTGAMRRWNS
jgi:hypothetical protein